jgi:glycosyltransferase involved in cell wall biosynthesis
MTKTILITKIADFIDFHMAKQPIERGYKVIGIDNLYTYYDVDLKYSRLPELGIAITNTDFYGREFNSSCYGHLSFYQLKLEDLYWKKVKYIFESLNRLIFKDYKFSIDIYGDGPLKEFLNFRIIQLGLVKFINLKGYVNNNKLKTIYKNYKLAVQHLLSEVLSNGLINFMMHDLPCVVSNVGGMTEVIIYNKNGVVFDISKPSDLNDAILLALDLNFLELKKFNNLHKTKFERKYEVKQLNNLYVIND